MHVLQLHEAHPCGFKASFNHTYDGHASSETWHGWVSPYCFGLNVGPIVLMLENHRSGMLWNLMRSSAPIICGLRRAGFEGGWLNAEHGSES
jgi:hypothetical protein